MNVSAIVIQCQQCGGTAEPVSGREYLQCQYCQSLVFTNDHPLTVDRIATVDGNSGVDCPACRNPLQTGQVDSRPVLFCGTCYGILLKNEHFGAVVRERRARRNQSEAEPARPLNMTEYDRSVNCPNCHRRMETHPYYGPGNVVMDSCSQCHLVWMDHGEIRTIERSEGGREPDALPMYINSSGQVTFIPPAQSQ